MPHRFRKPSYLLHKPTGQARVRIDGRDNYLGEYGTPESYERYDAIVADYLRSRGQGPGRQMTIGELAVLYVKFARTYYVKHGLETSEVNNIRIALRPLVKLHRATRACDFSPKKLKDVREAIIQHGCVRTSINRQVDRIRRMFKWAVSEEIVGSDVYVALQTVTGLRVGRSAAGESDPVQPVPVDHIQAIEDFVTRQIWAIIQVQLHTGARPTEVLTMRGRDINRSGLIWEYVPQEHKTQHHGKRRVIFIGPTAQKIVREFLKPELDTFLFSPADAMAEFRAQQRASRQSPLTPSQRARHKVRVPRKKPRARYDVQSYRRAIVVACRRAKVPEWSPGQLRHNFATTARRQFGIEATRTVLGHSSAVTSEIYAEKDFDAARAVIAKIG